MPSTTPIPLSSLSPSEYQLWKDAQLLGHFEAWKRERRDNRARIEKLEAEVAEMAKALAEIRLETRSLPSPSNANTAFLPRNPNFIHASKATADEKMGSAGVKWADGEKERLETSGGAAGGELA
ncbi:hypothetical protein MMC08_002151, partial [Hypocenomyce scalaris]|nr:hypothetical protein [Hypocenomyce scalaris]